MATMRDVAARAGVSIATVSFLLNDTKPVAPATRDRIEQAMAELGFRRNMVARALASRRTRVLALAYPAVEHAFNFSTSISFLTGAARRASELGYHLVIWPVGNDAQDLTELVGQGLVDGVLLMEIQLEDRRVAALLESGTPQAMIGRTADPAAIPHVDFDFLTTMDTALDHLHELGHRDVALMIGSQELPGFHRYGAYVRTEEAFWAGTRLRGMRPALYRCEPSVGAGRQVARQIAGGATTAVLTMNERATIGLVSEATRQGHAVPDRLSVVSLFSTADASEYSDPELTYLAAPGGELGQLGVEALVSILDGDGPFTPRLLPGVLRVRGSSGPAPTSGGGAAHQ